MNDNEPKVTPDETKTTSEDGILHITREYGINFEKGIYPLATLIYLIIGIYWGMWHPGWLVFVGAWLLTVVFHYFRTSKLKISIYGLAAIIFLWLSFGWGYWTHAWLVFIAAWVIDTMVVSTKPKKKKKKERDEDEGN
ncbi:MAG: hypothetical protein FWF78_08160 [Defluviitaleaceae bacterium]|nr:hypothetical protein [Defluviitaleaceae bacterium]